eukprot:jgi/Mesen1/1710/ME000138S00564
MTTAARPTWAPAKGGEEQGGARMFGPSQKYSSRDLASHTKLKTRKEGQDTAREVKKRDLRGDLEEKERRHFKARDREYGDERQMLSSAALLEGPGDRHVEERIIPKSIDADDSDGDVQEDSESDEDDDDDEDDTAELLAELERIKKERAEERARQDRKNAEEEAKVKEAELVRGNPLVSVGANASFSVKRRWDDDVVFRNQSKGEQKPTKRFINDTIRSDFHRRFLNKYVK